MGLFQSLVKVFKASVQMFKKSGISELPKIAEVQVKKLDLVENCVGKPAVFKPHKSLIQELVEKKSLGVILPNEQRYLTKILAEKYPIGGKTSFANSKMKI